MLFKPLYTLQRMKGFIVYATYDIYHNQTVVQLYGRLENGQSFATLNTIEPYFFLAEKDAKKASPVLENHPSVKTACTNFKGESVMKVSAQNHLILSKIAESLHKKEIDTYEADVKPHTRFLIDRDIFASLNIEGKSESNGRVDHAFKEPVLTPAAASPKLKVISLDTESSHKNGNLFCIGMYAQGYEKNFLVSKIPQEKKMKDVKNSQSLVLEHDRESKSKDSRRVVLCSTEADALEQFKEELIKLDPDIITGWNIIDFDLNYLKEKFKKNKISFDLGRTDAEVRLRIESGFFKSSSAIIPGRQVLDAFNLIKDPYIKEAPSIKNAEFESFSLESVSLAILGEGKLIKGKNRHEEIEKIYTTDQQKLVNYNLLDCKLAFDILEKTAMLDLAMERSELTGMSLDRVGASVAAFDSLYIREARKRSLVSPTTRYVHKETGITGGYVKSLKPGIYNNVLILDFKSLYPSIMRTFNIDPASLLEKKEKGAIESPNSVFFKNQKGILPDLIEKMHLAREKAKKDKRELASYAIKVIMNAFFGVLANPNCRYYNHDMANAITHFGQMIIKLTAEEIEKKGYKVIYSDTDSVFIESGLSTPKAKELGKEIQSYINEFYNEYAKKNYGRTSFLELQFAKLYLSLMIPAVRVVAKDAEEKAAKKRYAGLISHPDGKEELEIVGLEAIRGDWTEAAGDFQRELLLKVFHKESVDTFIKDYISSIKKGKMDAKLVYRKSIRKDLSEYTKTTPPHVKAARKLDKLDSNVISYFMTLDGPEPTQKLTHPLDYEHYIKKQIEPIANQVLSLFGKSLEDILKNSKQSTLF